MTSESPSGAPPAPHSAAEDLFALFSGTMLVAAGVTLFKAGGLATGGTTGLALLAHYFTGFDLGVVLFAVNLPFYVFAWLRMGMAFTLKTFAAVALLSAEVWAFPKLIAIGTVQPLFAAVLAGLFVGVGLLILIRHKASLGGIGVMAFYLQDRFGWRAGMVQMIADCTILLAALLRLAPAQIVVSVVGAVVLNLVLWINHREGRYAGY